MVAQAPRTGLEYNEALFTVAAAMNACGYDQELGDSLPVRTEIRNEVQRAAQGPDAQQALLRLCKFYNDHNAGDPSRNLSQYTSLALNLGEAPAFRPKMNEADLPPDATYVLGLVPLLQNFYVTTDMQRLYRKHRAEYEKAVEQLHEPVNELLVSTDLYLRRPSASYLGRAFVVYVEPQVAPGQTNSRNYADDYYVVVSPDRQYKVNAQQVRHTYLHFIFDPMSLKRGRTLQKLMPLLNAVQGAPMAESYKNDVGLLMTESLIQAIEARQIGGRKGPEQPRLDAVEHAMSEGFVLTRYFYDELVKFEKGDTGLDQAFGDWLYTMNIDALVKEAQRTTFAKTAAEEVVAANRRPLSLVDMADRALASGNSEAAEKYASDALERQQDEGRAMFTLARAYTLEGKLPEARETFFKTLQSAKDSRILAWTHIYLGRIFDLTDDRESALKHYNAALQQGDNSQATKTAAERGLKEPYAPTKK